MNSLTPEIVAQICYFIGPDNSLSLRTTCKDMYGKFLNPIPYIAAKYDLAKLPYVPKKPLKLYKFIAAIFELSVFGSDYVDKFFTSYKQLCTGVLPEARC